MIAFLAFVALGYRNATAAPVVRRLAVHVQGYPAGAAATRIVLLSDIHAHGPDMPPSRIAAIVGQVNALQPDIVVVAGDFVGDSWMGDDYPIAAAIAPLARLRARLGVYAVLGNSFLGGANLVAALVRPYVRPAKMVWSVRNSEFDQSVDHWLARVSHSVETALARSPDAIIANSKGGRAFAIGRGFPGSKITLVPNGIDTERFRQDSTLRQAAAKARAGQG